MVTLAPNHFTPVTLTDFHTNTAKQII